MLIIDEATLSSVQTQLVAAAHGLRTVRGQTYTMGTIDEKRLRGAALAALSVIAGVAVDTSIDALPPKS